MDAKSSGITPDLPTENEQILEEILELVQSTPIWNTAVDSKNEEKKRKEALATRELGMATWWKAAKRKEAVHMEDKDNDDDENLTEQLVFARKRKRRSCADPIQYLAV